MIVSTEQLKQMIMDYLLYDSRLNAADIRIEVIGHKVTLFGTVPNARAYRAAIEDVLFIAGTHAVGNDLAGQASKMYSPDDARPASGEHDASAPAPMASAVDLLAIAPA